MTCRYRSMLIQRSETTIYSNRRDTYVTINAYDADIQTMLYLYQSNSLSKKNPSTMKIR